MSKKKLSLPSATLRDPDPRQPYVTPRFHEHQIACMNCRNMRYKVRKLRCGGFRNSPTSTEHDVMYDATTRWLNIVWRWDFQGMCKWWRRSYAKFEHDPQCVLRYQRNICVCVWGGGGCITPCCGYACTLKSFSLGMSYSVPMRRGLCLIMLIPLVQEEPELSHIIATVMYISYDID